MRQNDHFNIYEYLKNDLEIDGGELLDVGCGDELTNLLDFASSNFQKIVGIDKKLPMNPAWSYYSYLLKKGVETFDIARFDETNFGRKLNLDSEDIFDFDYKSEYYSLIICTSVLHFYRDEIKYALIDTFLRSIKEKGLIFIRLNHSEHPYDTNPLLARKICANVYQSLSNLEEIRYLVDKEEFVRGLKQYNINIIDRFTLVTDKTITIVIRK